MHDHEHDHDHGPLGHHHHHGDDGGREEHLDAANQSLADALRASFRILKGIMVILVLLYFVSGVKFIEPNEKAVVAQLGEIQAEVHEPGLLAAWPYPIDEVIRLPVKEASELAIESHMIQLTEEEKKRGLAFVSRGHGSGLNPIHDGALLCADKGMVHLRWVITYKITNLANYVRNLKGRDLEAAESLLTALVENAAIHVAASMTTEDLYRRQVDQVRTEVMRLVNRDLEELGAGIEVSEVKIPVSIVPFQVRDAFENSQKAENARRQVIQEADKERFEILNKVAGGSYQALVPLLDEIDLAERRQDAAALAELNKRLEDMLEHEVSGEAGRRIKEASGRYAETVGRIENDVRIYRALLPEYERNPRLMMARLWDDTRNLILNNPEVVKIYRPFNVEQLRIHVGPDPEQEREAEMQKYRERLEEEALPPGTHMVPIGPE